MTDDYRPVVGEPILSGDGYPICPGCNIPFSVMEGIARATVTVTVTKAKVKSKRTKSDCRIITDSITDVERYHCRNCHKLLARDIEEAKRIFDGYQVL
jgi:hypothetical protein